VPWSPTTTQGASSFGCDLERSGCSREGCRTEAGAAKNRRRPEDWRSCSSGGEIAFSARRFEWEVALGQPLQ
jgi:hypothetical protein